MLARGVLWVTAMLLIASPLHAETVEPWAVGVSDEQKADAQTLFEEGNALQLEHQYVKALERYRKAIAIWDSPSIRFNIVRCLIQLGRPLEAEENLDHALAYGKEALQDGLYEEGLEFKTLLASQIGEIVVRCTEPGVALSLDGRALGTCPVERSTRVVPGQHQVVGAKRGYMTETKNAIVLGGKREVVTIAPVTIDAARIETHRWPIAVPWVVLGGGLAVAGIGGLLRLEATNDIAAYDDEIRKNCRTTGCTPDMLDEGLRLRATHENDAAIGAVTVGIAGAVVGGVMLYFNRGVTVYPEVSPSGAALTARGTF
jgi:hypothetical protein